MPKISLCSFIYIKPNCILLVLNITRSYADQQSASLNSPEVTADQYPQTLNKIKKKSCVTNCVQQNYDNADACDSFQTFCGSPKRTILLDDIDDVEDEEDLQDHLEIHFQKPSNYGGEIESIKYISTGKTLHAFFCEDMVEMEDWL